MNPRMALDDLALALQRLLDRLARRLRLGAAPARTRRRLLVVQLDGLSRVVFEEALAAGRMPFVRRLLARGGFRVVPMSVGLPSSTPAFQMAAMYGVRPDIPGFHYHDKRRRADVYFPRGDDAGWVERTQAAGRRGIVSEGSTYGCIFTGGAANSLFTFATIKRPAGRGLLRALSAVVILAWVVAKSALLSMIEVARATLRLIADPVGVSARGWKWLAIKLGISVWLRQLFTLAASRDLYMGTPVVYVNFLDYDVVAHAYGPRHLRAFRALHRVDRSIRVLWRVCRRVPEHRYELHVLSDHGQARCTPYAGLGGEVSIEHALLDDFCARATRGTRATATRRQRWRSGLASWREQRTVGMFQRCVNYLERDFPWVLGGHRGVAERDGVRVIAAGPNAFVYFVREPAPLTIDAIDARFPGLAEDISRARGVGFVLARSPSGPVCCRRGKRYVLGADAAGPFSDRVDAPLVVAGVCDLMAMPSAGDLVIYGIDAPEGNVSYVPEVGAHAGTSPDEMQTFVLAPVAASLPTPLTHPIQLYPYFLAYQRKPAA